MGLFGKKSPKKSEDNGGCSYIPELARLMTDNEAVIANLSTAIEDPDSYFADNAARFAERGIDVKNGSRGEMYWIALTDELCESGCAFEVDYKCELEDFLWALEQLDNYGLISDDIGSLKLDEDEDIEAWGEEINRALAERAFVCYIDIDSDSYPLVIVSGDALEEVRKLAADNGHSIEDF